MGKQSVDQALVERVQRGDRAAFDALVLVALVGGGIGVAIGIVAAQGLALAGLAAAQVDWLPFAVAFVACSAVAIAFGWQPARAAARLDPTASLRGSGT
jgi:putative ABC transport system permease protein